MKIQKILHKLVSFKSISLKENLSIIDYISSHFKLLGVKPQIIKGEKDRVNLYARIGPDNLDGIMFSGHTDVVPVEGQSWNSNPFSLKKVGTKLYGRGTTDMKGFIAVTLSLLPKIQNSSLKKPIHFMFSYDEEIGCIGIQKAIPFLKNLKIKPTKCIVGEPTKMQVINKHKGKKNFLITFNGIEAHSSLIESGVNSINYAADFINFLNKKQTDLMKKVNKEFFPPYSSINVGTISGGIALNIIPKNCQVEFEIRNLPSDDTKKLLNEIKNYLFGNLEKKMKKLNKKCFINFEITNNFPGLDTDKDEEVINLCLNSNKSNKLGTVSFGTEAGIFDKLNLQTIVCGPGSIEQAHKPNEYIEIEQLKKCEVFLKNIVNSCC